MKEFKDKVAVITGAASGLGRAIADHCVQEGMKVVLADVELEALTKTEASMKASGGRCWLSGPMFPRPGTSKHWPKRPLRPLARPLALQQRRCRYGARPSGKAPSRTGSGSSASISGA